MKLHANAALSLKGRMSELHDSDRIWGHL